MNDIHKNYVAGEWLGGDSATRNVNPSDTNDVVGLYAQASAAQLDAAVAAARAAFPAWSRTSPQERHDILARVSGEIAARREELGRLLAREEGKTLPEAIGEVGRAAQIFDFFAGEALRIPGEKFASVRPGVDIEVTREAVGVVGIIAPWNFPIAIPAWKIAPALCYGNCVVFKPADLVPGCAHALAEIIVRAGVPKGVFNLVMGRGSVVGQAMLEHRHVDAITFTGSVATGRKVAAACAVAMRKFQLEMGGKNPLVVLDDADLKTAVECAVNGAYFSTGQRCTASSRLIVTQGIYPRFAEALAERMRGLVVDDARKPGVHIGPVVDQNQLDQDLSYVRIGQDEGAKLALGGERLNRATPGFYMAPALFVDVDNWDAHRPRGDFRPGRGDDPGARLRRRAGARQRHRIRPLRRHLHDEPQIRLAFQAQRRGRHDDGQPADRGRRLSRAVRRPQRLEPRLARAGPLRRRVLHDGQDRLYDGVRRGEYRGADGMILISGEALIDLIPDPEKDGRYDAVLGGSPYNVAIGLARLGAPTAFVSRISADANGESLAAALTRDGVDLSFIARDSKPTPLAFVMRGTAQTGSRYSFYLDATAFDGRWPFPAAWPAGARHLHVGSLAAVDPRHGESVVAALRLARGQATTSFDPNIRPLVTPDRESVARAGRAAGLPLRRRQGERRGSAVALSRPHDRGHARPMGAARAELLRGDARTSRRRRLSRRPAFERNGAEGRGRRHRRRRRQFHVLAALPRWIATARSAQARRHPPSSVSRHGSPSPRRPRRSPAHAKAPIRRRSQK